MNVKITDKKPNKKILEFKVDKDQLDTTRRQVLRRLGKDVSAPGFRPGKAPIEIIEKQLKPELVQQEVIEEVVNRVYIETIREHKLRPIDNPKVEIKKFVPYQSLEFTAEIDVLPPVKLGDYKKIKAKRESVKVKESEVDQVLENISSNMAEKAPVKRKAKIGDEVEIDFSGFDEKGKPISGASGKNFKLKLGSKTFIPGFEENIVGMKPGEKKEFELTFPKDYHHKPLAGKKVKFELELKQVVEVKPPEINNEFAKKVGPFANLDALKSDIRLQLNQQKQQELDNKLKDKIVNELVEKSTILVPETLVEDQIKHIKEDFIRNLAYRGITLEEYLKQIGLSEEEWVKKEVRPQAEKRIKIGLVISEVALKENLTVGDEELALRIQMLKQQYQDPAAQAEFDKPQMQQDIANRMLTEKTLNKLVDYATEEK